MAYSYGWLGRHHSIYSPEFAQEMAEQNPHQRIQNAWARYDELAAIEERRAELEQFDQFRSNWKFDSFEDSTLFYVKSAARPWQPRPAYIQPMTSEDPDLGWTFSNCTPDRLSEIAGRYEKLKKELCKDSPLTNRRFHWERLREPYKGCIDQGTYLEFDLLSLQCVSNGSSVLLHSIIMSL